MVWESSGFALSASGSPVVAEAKDHRAMQGSDGQQQQQQQSPLPFQTADSAAAAGVKDGLQQALNQARARADENAAARDR